MSDAETGSPSTEPRGDWYLDARCQLCSRVAGQVVGRVFVHHPDCTHTPAPTAGLPRCCHCGGRLYLEPTTGAMLSAADREAARHSRPSRW